MCWLQQSAQLWSYPTFLLVPLMVLASIECFAGYRAWRFLLGVNGAVLGFVAGAFVSMLCGAPMLVLVGAVAGAVVGGVLFACVVPLGSFVFAFGSLASLTILLAHIVGAPGRWIMPLAGAAGLAGALAALTACRPVIIAIAAVAGAQQLASAWHAWHVPFGSLPLPDDIRDLAIFIALATIGLLLQFATSVAIPRNPSANRDPPDLTRSTISPTSTSSSAGCSSRD